jgi:hypothetical protein
MDVAVHFEKVAAGFSRYHKYTLGTDLRTQSRAIVALVVRANAAQDKQPHLLRLREALDELLISVRIAEVAPGILPPATLVHPCTSEAKAFKSFKSFQFAIEQVVSVCLQGCRQGA